MLSAILIVLFVTYIGLDSVLGASVIARKAREAEATTDRALGTVFGR